MDITHLIIINSIIYNLKGHFGDAYKYYNELIPQDFVKPSFAVSLLDSIKTKGYTGHNVSYLNSMDKYLIKFFPRDKSVQNKQINEVLSEIEFLFRYVYLVNPDNEGNFKLDEEGNVKTVPHRVNNIVANISDGVLIVQLQIPVRKIIMEEYDTVKMNTLKENIKNI